MDPVSKSYKICGMDGIHVLGGSYYRQDGNAHSLSTHCNPVLCTILVHRWV